MNFKYHFLLSKSIYKITIILLLFLKHKVKWIELTTNIPKCKIQLCASWKQSDLSGNPGQIDLLARWEEG